MKKKLTRALALTFSLALSLSALAGCGSSGNGSGGSSSAPGQEITTVKVGIVGDLVEPWEVAAEQLKDEGIEIELVQFAEYKTPNKALDSGEIDLNAFQHYAYLKNEVKDNGYDIVPIGETILGPMRVFSSSLSSLDQLQPGAKAAIPNDVTNGGRAIKILEGAGLIKVDPAAGYTPAVEDITENRLNLELVEVDAATIPSLLPDVSIAVINNNYAFDAKLDPNSALYAEAVDTQSENPYINVIVAKTENKDKEIYKKVVDAYHSDAVAKVLIDTYGGVYIPVWDYTYTPG